MLILPKDKENWINILIRLTEKCSSNCEFCSLPYLNVNKVYDLNKVDNILDFCKKNCSIDFIIGFLWYDLFNLDKFESIIDLINLKYFQFNYIFQIWLDDILNKSNYIKKYTSNNIWFWVQVIYKTKSDIEKLLLCINKIIEHNLFININFICDFHLNNKIIDFLKLKFNFIEVENRQFIKFTIWKSVVELENHVKYWKEENFNYEKCEWYANFKIINNNIIIYNDIEITLTWNIKFHLNNYCNKWIKKIWCITNSRKQILKNFTFLETLLVEYDKKDNKCISCIKKPINI